MQLWNGDDLDDAMRARLVGLFRLTFRDPADMIERIRGEPVYLLAAMTPDEDVAVEAAKSRDRPADPATGGSQLRSTALARIAVGVVVERRKARSVWVDFLWRPVSVFVGNPSAAPWTPLDTEAETTLFYAGEAVIELHRTETANYRNNLASGAPALWVALRPAASEPPYEILAVTADPAEGEAFTDAGSNLVETVPMPPDVVEAVARFIAEHHVERPFVKRRRQPAEPTPARRGNGQGGRGMTAPENFVSRWARLKRDSERQRRANRRHVEVSAAVRKRRVAQPQDDAVDG